MPENIPAKPLREKIAAALAEKEDLLQPSDSVQTVSDKMGALNTNLLPVSEGGRLVGLADESNHGRKSHADPSAGRGRHGGAGQ